MAWTDPRTWVTGEIVTAAELNEQIRDNLGALPRELDHQSDSNDHTISGASSSAANTIITSAALTYDGSTTVWIEFSCYAAEACFIGVYEDGTLVATVAEDSESGGVVSPILARCRRTPSSGSHTYTVQAWKTGSGTGQVLGATGPIHLTITQA